MKTYISILFNSEADDLFAAIIQDGKCFCYSHIGQHSIVSKGYLKDSNGVELCEASIDLHNEVMSIYSDCNPVLLKEYEFKNIIDNEQIRFNL